MESPRFLGHNRMLALRLASCIVIDLDLDFAQCGPRVSAWRQDVYNKNPFANCRWIQRAREGIERLDETPAEGSRTVEERGPHDDTF